MKDQLMRYIELLFTDAPDAYELRHEILQDSLQKYDELRNQGICEKEAYRITAESIGDIESALFSYRHTHGVLNEKPYRSRFRKALFVAWGLLVMGIGTLFLLNWESLGADLLALVTIATGGILLICGTTNLYVTRVYITASGKRRNIIITVIDLFFILAISVFYIICLYSDIDTPSFLIITATYIRSFIETVYTCIEIQRLAPYEQRKQLQKQQLSHAMVYGAFILVMTAATICDISEHITIQAVATILYIIAGAGLIVVHPPQAPYAKDPQKQFDAIALIIALVSAIAFYPLSNNFAVCGAAFLIVCAIILLIRQYREIGEFNRYQRQSTTM